MACCPACGESRWVYPRQQALGRLTQPLAGCHPYKCKSCGWRGWLSVPEGSALLHLLYRQAAVVYHHGAILCHRAAILVRRFPALQRFVRPRVAAWVITSIVIGLVVAGVRFSAQRSTARPLGSAPTVEPLAPSSPRLEQPVESASLSEPAVVPVVDDSRVGASPSPVAARPSVTSEQARTGQLEGVRPAARRAADAGQATPADLPAYRGSLVITSDPPGALVVVDGQVIGPTPVVLKDVRAGSRVVRIESNGYQRWSAAARVVAEKETKLNATLQRGSQP